MSSFDTQFEFSALPGFRDQDGESITYHPGDGSLSRTITAVGIERDAIEPVPELSGSVMPSAIIAVQDDSTLGISLAELDEHNDEIEYAVRVGASAERRGIWRLLSQQAGILRLAVR